MLPLSRYLLPLCACPLLASCVFLLDYDELQSGSPSINAGGAADQAGGASATGDAGAPASGGASSACGSCDDHDPCTMDSCDETGSTPTCQHHPNEGLVLDGFETKLSAEKHLRVSLVGSGQLFYLAELELNKNAPKVALYRLASDGDALEPMATDLRLEGTPVSNVGLAVEELPLGEVALHGFVATKLKLAEAAARVFHVVSHADKTTTNLVGASYKADNPNVFPQALATGKQVIGAWIQADGSIAVHDVGSAKTETFGATSLAATTLSLLSTSGEQPAVLFTAQAGARQALGTYVETSGQNRSKLSECETRPGDYVSSSVIGTQIPGVWLAEVTRAGDAYLTTGSGTLLCGTNMCTAQPEDCTKATPSNGLRDVAGATVRFDGDAPGVIYSVLAVPQVGAKPEAPSVVEARLSLVLGRSDFSTPSKPKSTTIGGDPVTGLMQIARSDADMSSGFAGPDWPAISILPTKQVAVAWIQPNAAADGSELHVRRYKMCLPAP